MEIKIFFDKNFRFLAFNNTLALIFLAKNLNLRNLKMISQHPLLLCERFRFTQRVQEVVQTVCLVKSFTEGLTFYLSQKVAQFIVSFQPFAMIPFWTSALIYKVSEDNESLLRKICWIAPVTGIAISSLAAYKLYAVSTTFLVKGAITGVHSFAMTMFGYSPFSAGFLGLISLTDVAKTWFLNPNRFGSIGQKSLISSRSETVAALAFFVASISLTIILKNPILANTVAYTLASLTKVAVMRTLAEIALYRLPKQS